MDKALLVNRIQELSSPLNPIPTDQEPQLQQLGGIHCVAFDFYGTMFLSGVGDIGIDEEQSEESRTKFEEALVDTGFEVTEDAAEKGLNNFDRAIRDYKKLKRSEGIDHPEPDIVLIWYEVLNYLIKQNYIEGDLDRGIAERFSVEYEFRFNAVWPVPDLMDTLAALREKRYILGIVSNSQFYTPVAFEALTNRDVHSAGFDKDLLVWSYQASVKKPSIHFYERFVEALRNKHKMKPKNVLYVGNDMLKDIMPASTLGMKTALFAGDTRSLKLRQDDPRCENIDPDLIITELRQLTECVGLAV
ncbi:HAD family hydrolase [Aliifodinibius sp. S!AR15-10]|uniref:HAD family hydrolase n=1 Tax=Aliifodinibius sp. S!AR15-10 TaxID=2950437 RepID=UPI00285D321D|nr:HAD family hydrolase [Aliifodinibius sp. S!AR15-10]MDR8390305.1 HAD family hydrolase [Aliifodinibius sp. S!AR15-10]